MKMYRSTNECISISENHAVFNFTIWEDSDTLLVKGNVIVNRKLEHNATSRAMVKNTYAPEEVLQEVIDDCVCRAKFIFEE